ncbi:hypothetical protein PVK06_003587 [Gossypium arboreum]|uniref:Uncharacterized protein n=1 Tax=Gossypium arboreum TaxID=29729 RepID=A0ABR0R7Y9_GOSAR|nr:hypothetical protein PVK06_003587 [Gossypium arboreum]
MANSSNLSIDFNYPLYLRPSDTQLMDLESIFCIMRPFLAFKEPLQCLCSSLHYACFGMIMMLLCLSLLKVVNNQSKMLNMSVITIMARIGTQAIVLIRDPTKI